MERQLSLAGADTCFGECQWWLYAPTGMSEQKPSQIPLYQPAALQTIQVDQDAKLLAAWQRLQVGRIASLSACLVMLMQSALMSNNAETSQGTLSDLHRLKCATACSFILVKLSNELSVPSHSPRDLPSAKKAAVFLSSASLRGHSPDSTPKAPFHQ